MDSLSQYMGNQWKASHEEEIESIGASGRRIKNISATVSHE